MDNSYFIITDKDTPIEIERFHICSWEFKNESALIEFGCEVDASKLIESGGASYPQKLELEFYIPWITQDCAANDLYEKLKKPSNKRC